MFFCAEAKIGECLIVGMFFTYMNIYYLLLSRVKDHVAQDYMLA